MNPPPITTDPTIAAAGSLLAERKGLLREWVVEVMRSEWGVGHDIGEEAVLLEIGARIGLENDELQAAFADPDALNQLQLNWVEAQDCGLIGVPSFQIGEEIFWGSDRIEYVLDHLRQMRLRRI